MTARTDEITLRSPIDAHVHLRQGEMLQRVVRHTAETFSAAVVMPNTEPPVFDAALAVNYREAIERWSSRFAFLPCMTAYFGEWLSRENLESLRPCIVAVKFYPEDLTTNAHHGCDPSEPWVDRVLADMEELGITLCVHPEAPGYFAYRERLFASTAHLWATRYRRLRIILEHVSDLASIELLRSCPNVFATVTPHHLLLTGNDWVGPPLRPHLYCMPVAKRPEDRYELVRLATGRLDDRAPLSGRVMLGTDSAPHPRDRKESAECCAGIFSAPIALQLVTQAFDCADALDRLQQFVSDNAQRIHGICPPEKTVRLVRRPFRVPEEYDGVVPMFAGRELEWSIEV